MDEILRRLDALEHRLSVLETGVTRSSAVAPREQNLPPPPPVYRAESPGSGVMDTARARIADVAGHTGSHPKDIESYIGRWMLGVVGIIAIIFGASFFLKYAFDNNIIGETGRVMLGVFGGLGFIVLGEILRPRLEKYSFILSGGGLALLYLSIYAAYAFYPQTFGLSQTGAFAFMSAVTAFGVILSVWANAMPLASLAAFGGFLTPFLIGSTHPNDMGFFSYIALLNLGILAVAFSKNWRALTLLGFLGTMINFAAWFGTQYHPEKLFFTIYALVTFYAIYVCTSVVANLSTKEASNEGDLFILSINPAWFFGWLYFLLKPDYEYSLGFIAAALGAVYIFFAYLASTIHREDSKFALFLGAIAVLFLTIAVPLQLHQNAITIAWAMEAAILFVLGFVVRNEWMRKFALMVFVLAGMRLFALDSGSGDLAQFMLVFNKRFFTYLMVIIGAAIMGYAATAEHALLTVRERGIGAFLWGAANVLLLIVITLEIYTFYDARIYVLTETYARAAERNTPADQRGEPYAYNLQYQAELQAQNSSQYRSLSNQRNAAISVFWTLYAILFISLGMAWRNTSVRWSALALFGVTIAKVFLYDLASLRTPYRIVSFMVLGFILLGASYLYFQYEKKLKYERELPQ
ncbi:MAG: hypothetical protein A3C84_03500 [Candidatus Ryanbacteria bacterium RIFCSPHIGHO2_02_FULL_48_12]|uniref:DUF2339 domain-containing protein n=1 Tax=Candidatus Ryanbacteria bacterium RIFCSPHIGHO2_01_FULL_48_27 TaxID=1802115 RepID=A0A1G2G6F2_9BACT|nr:MAG: hypothetical protein A2756_02870 [Candidatus Ryanbacteria bacterium RIFCSPHIGHO2_01_FULL_48_27]OGZ49409.1 MAG: hypothetical protein A3C84_03500 [Candidatus Ryanbacteria bacterium RIFCSPHIGHO2_02_FULL_48_12]